jgi:hypothetical protein
VTQRTKPVLRRNPHRQIKIFAFMPDFDPGSAEFPKPRDFLPQRLGRRADDRHGLNFLEGHQRVGHDIRGSTKIVL